MIVEPHHNCNLTLSVDERMAAVVRRGGHTASGETAADLLVVTYLHQVVSNHYLGTSMSTRRHG